jgi:endonuclease/exonuclease/phosphatase family metal-dependent hydrolase
MSRFCRRVAQRRPSSIIFLLFAPIFLFQPQTSLHSITTTATVTSNQKKSTTAVAALTHQDSRLTIASWNLRVPFPQDLQLHLSWEERRDAIISAIHQHQPDLLAVQEDCYFMNSDILQRKILPNTTTNDNNKAKAASTTTLSDVYNRYGLFNRNGETQPSSHWPINAFSSIAGRDGEHNSIYYNRRRFQLLHNLTFWLSDTPEVPSSFDEVTARIVNCVLVQDRTSCQHYHGDDGNDLPNKDHDEAASSSGCTNYFYCSTHFPSGNITRQLKSVHVLSHKFAQYRHAFASYNNIIMMIAGDFNSPPESVTYNAMISSGFVDLRSLTKESMPLVDYSSTTNDWYGANDEMIDHIWFYPGNGNNGDDNGIGSEVVANNRMNVLSMGHAAVPCCGIDDSMNRTASDHLLLLADSS